MNTHVFSGPKTREVTEIGLLPFILAFANEDFRDYTLLPVFPLRVFRHKSIFIRTDRGIAVPADLRGRRVATPGYSSTSLTWIRGIMQHEYGVTPKDIEWVISSKESSARRPAGPRSGRTSYLKASRSAQVPREKTNRSCSSMVMWMPCFTRLNREPFRKDIPKLPGCLPTLARQSKPTSLRPESFPSCTQSPFAGICCTNIPGCPRPCSMDTPRPSNLPMIT